MKTLTNLALNIVMIIEGFIIVTLLASFFVSLPPHVFFEFGNLGKTNTALVTGGVFILIIHLISFKQGVEHQWRLVTGCFIAGQILTGIYLYLALREVDTPNTIISQSLAWFMAMVISTCAGVLAYVIVSTQRQQVGEHVEKVWYKIRYALLILGGLVGFVIGTVILIYLFNENQTTPSAVAIFKYLFSDEVVITLLFTIVFLLLAFMKNVVAIAVQSISAIGLAVFSIAFLLLIILQVVGIAPNDINFWILTVIASNASCMSGIFWLELLFVFAHEAGH